MNENNHNVLICRFPIFMFLFLLLCGLGENSVIYQNHFCVQNPILQYWKYMIVGVNVIFYEYCNCLLSVQVFFKYFITPWSLITLCRKANGFITIKKLFVSYAKIKSCQEIHLYEIFHCNLGSLITFSKLQLHYSLFCGMERTHFIFGK